MNEAEDSAPRNLTTVVSMSRCEVLVVKQAERYGKKCSGHCISAAAPEEVLSMAMLLVFGRRAKKVTGVSGMERGVSQN